MLQLAKLFGGVVAPTTLLTSLLLFFGASYATVYFDHFGVDTSLLGLTTQDYLIFSIDGLFVPLAAIACAGLLVLWAHAMLRARLAAGYTPRALRVLVPVLALVGFVLAVAGLSSVFVRTAIGEYLAVAPLCLATGVLLLVYAVHLRGSLTAAEHGADLARRPEWMAVAEWAGVFVLVGLSLFWAVSDYSAAVGRGRANQVAADLPTDPQALLYSERSLSLAAPGVREVRCQDPDAAYRFRYDGLKLMLQSGDQYLFVPATWSTSDGVAIVLPRTDTLRLEFRPADGAVAPPTC
ncbi:MAG: hypothetical protein GEU83_08505 [Pseudonocardiaceae bacterium]|nr:hypothetical protein [Pseudonocardiaceae bacterium]